VTWLITLLLIICVSSNTLVVSQSPDISVLERQTGRISCCWTVKAQRVGVKWIKNQTMIEQRIVINEPEVSQNERPHVCSVLILTNLTSRDSGRYICKVSVELPILTEVEGNGTTITVKVLYCVYKYSNLHNIGFYHFTFYSPFKIHQERT
uniref:Ig-like domain-containing protein n=1 Tax=Cyprinodon variegatus TaxID=28743 RepID=A0A3Q2DY66_CYPVA